MKRWKLSYELDCQYSRPVSMHFYSLRCFPQALTSQKVNSMTYRINLDRKESWGKDSFGNPLLTGYVEQPHTRLWLRLEAEVETEDRMEPEPRPDWCLGMYGTATPLTAVGPSLKAFGAAEAGSGASPWQRAGELMEQLAGAVCYVSGSTGFDTSAEEAFSQKMGVCQDYAHILLALCRREGIRARYVAGAIPGEGASHAWVEVYDRGLWKGFDPTHNRCTDESYICFCYGRDAHDSPLNRGVFVGNTLQNQRITIRMEEKQ